MLSNRRDFIKHSLITSAYSSIYACQHHVKVVAPKNNKSLGVAIVGLGNYAQGLIAPALLLTEHAHLAGIVTGSPEKIPIWKQKYGINDRAVYSYDTMHQIADNDDIDVIYIIVPTALHAKYAVIAANAGKHVWCEKPMALNESQCQEIIDACHKNNVKLSIGYRMMHEPNTKTLISYRESMPVGKMTSILAESCYAGGEPKGWRAKKSMGGGAMYDMGVYAVNGIRYATGMDPIEVVSARHIIDRPELFNEVDESTVFQLKLKNGLMANGLTSVGKPNNQLRVDCEKGWYKLSPMQTYNGVVGERSDGVKMDIYVENQQAIQMENDALAILNDSEVRCPGSMGKKDVQIIEAIFRAAQTGSSVSIG